MSRTADAPVCEREATDTQHPWRVCFVCTGNTCRSPMAQAVANALAADALSVYPEAVRDALSPRVEAFSAGLYAGRGEPISAGALHALEGAGVTSVPTHDYRTHTAHTITETEAAEYDLLVGMTASHAMELLLRFPSLASKITRMEHEISDPFGKDDAAYAACLEQITQDVRALLAERGVG